MGTGNANLYESPALREFTAPVIRPGGLELTAQGLTHCRLAPNARVLDVGCGTGATVDYLRKQHNLAAIGLDFSTLLLEEGSLTYGCLPLMQGYAEQLPVADGRFNAILCECVLSLCSDPLHVLMEMKRVLEPEGYLVLTDIYTRKGPAAILDDKPSIHCCLKGAVGRSVVKNRLAKVGFALLLWEDHSTLLKQLAAQLIWSYGSLDAFRSTAGAFDVVTTMDGSGINECGKPGYYLLVAQKK